MAEAGAEVVAALVAGKVAGVLSGADQASYLLDLQIALHTTKHNCTTRGATKSYTVKGNHFLANSPIFFQIFCPKTLIALPEKDFEGYIRDNRQGQKEITTAGALKLAKVRVARPASPRFGLSHPEIDG